MGSSWAGHRWVILPEKNQHLSMQLKNARILFCGQEEEGSKEHHLLIEIHQTKIRKFPWMIVSAKPTPSSTSKNATVCKRELIALSFPQFGRLLKQGFHTNAHQGLLSLESWEHEVSIIREADSLPREVQSAGWTNPAAHWEWIRSQALSF